MRVERPVQHLLQTRHNGRRRVADQPRTKPNASYVADSVGAARARAFSAPLRKIASSALLSLRNSR